MPLRQESYLKDKKQNKFLSDALTLAIKRGELVYSSKNANFFMNEYELKDKKTGLYYGFIFSLLKVNEEKKHLELMDLDMTIKNLKTDNIHILERLPASGEANEHYMAETDDDTHFIIETVNRHAVWDENIENKKMNPNLSAFAFRISIHDSIDEYNSKLDNFPVDSKAGKVTGFADTFAMPADYDTKTPYTYFLGTVEKIVDVYTRLLYTALDFSIIYANTFFGLLPIVASKKVFDLSKIEKGKLVEVCADIKADFGYCATPKAIVSEVIEYNKKHIPHSEYTNSENTIMTEDEILKWAKDNNYLYPFDGIELAGAIDGSIIYALTTTSKETIFVGLPRFILIRNGKPEIVSGEAGLKMLDKLNQGDSK